MFLLWKRWQKAIVVFVLAVVAMEVRDAVALIRVVHDEAEGSVLTRIRFTLLENDVTSIAGET